MTSSVKYCITCAKSMGLNVDPVEMYLCLIRSNRAHSTRSMSPSNSGLSLPEYCDGRQYEIVDFCAFQISPQRPRDFACLCASLRPSQRSSSLYLHRI